MDRRTNIIKKANILWTLCEIGIFLVASIDHQCHSQQVYYANESSEIRATASNAEETRPTVFLTVSSLAAHPRTDERLLEMNWHNVPRDTEGESSVRLYSQDPKVGNVSEYLTSVEPHLHSEYYVTSIQFPRYTFAPHNLSNECLGFWIAYIKREVVITCSCIRSYPNWMHDLRDEMRNATLRDLLIPGTHNAGSYAYYDPHDDTIFKRYLITQEESVWHQLVYGIRYLDLRVSYERVSGSSDRFWITHGIFRTDISVRRVMNDVKAFLNATNEIVIMDFHRFVTGFTGKRSSSRHQSLISLLESELSEYMIPVSYTNSITLGELWTIGKRLYVSYAANSERGTSYYLFPAVRHLWGDKDNVHELFAYLNGSICVRRQRLTSAMAQLTPTTSGAIFDAYGGLRRMAHDVNRNLTRWFLNLWWQCANIVSTDFFLGSDIIRTAIVINKRRFSVRGPKQFLNHSEPSED